MIPLTVREAARVLGVAERTLYDRVREGRLDPALGAIRCGATTRFPARKMCQALGVTETELADMLTGGEAA